MKLDFEVKHQDCKLLGDNELVAGCRNYVYAHFAFTDDWDGLTKMVFFKQPESTFMTLVLDRNDCCLVPGEVLAEDGEFTIHLVGNEAGGTTITTNPLRLFVKGNDIITNDNTGTPTVDFLVDSVTAVKQYRDEVEQIGKFVQEKAEFVQEKAEFVADFEKVVADSVKTAEDSAKRAEEAAFSVGAGLSKAVFSVNGVLPDPDTGNVNLFGVGGSSSPECGACCNGLTYTTYGAARDRPLGKPTYGFVVEDDEILTLLLDEEVSDTGTVIIAGTYPYNIKILGESRV